MCPFFKIPSPRWESLHDMQGLGELYRITGNEDYKTAYVNLWKSIRRHDRHNTGGFSTGEQAIGNPYTPGAIETCCTTAWSAITQDILELTGDPLALDELELSLFNSILGSQHPSGRWFTYNTPMDGKREASAHTIVFQSRAGTPELNCCSVNAPRGLGMVSDWAVMSGPDNALYVHYLGPMKVALPKPDGNSVSIEVRSNYPADGKIWIQASQTGGDATPVFVQLPRWCSEIRLNGHGRPEKLLAIGLGAGASTAYAEFEIPMELRVWLGDGAQLGKASIYRGPLLLAFDQRDNPFDADALPALDFTSLLPGPFTPKGSFPPLTALSITAADKTAVALRDFATAGAAGTEYVSWLPITNAPPPDFGLQYPVLGDVLPGGPVMFKWSGDTRPEGWSYTVEIAADVDFSNVIYTGAPTPMPWHVVRASLEPGVRYFWRVRAKNGNGDTLSTSRALMDVLSVGVGQEALRVHAEKLGQAPLSLADHFTVDPAIKNDFIDNPAAYESREDGLIVGDCLDGKAVPAYGHVDLSQGLAPAPDRHGNPQGAVAFSGKGQVRYRTPGFPGDNYALSVWFNPSVPQAHMAQVFSAWSKGGDDPLRIVIDNGKVYARIEGNAGANSKGVPVEVGKWTHVAAVKAGGSLKFFVNGALVDTTGAPGIVPTLSKDVSIGSNPHHSGDEHFTGAIDDLALYARPLSDDEVKALAAAPPKF
jgi:hypothetical protein